MLRLREIRTVKVLDHEAGETRKVDALEFTFAGPVGDFAHFEITVDVKDRGTDAATLRVAEEVVRVAVVQLAHELEKQDVPQSPPAGA